MMSSSACLTVVRTCIAHNVRAVLCQKGALKMLEPKLYNQQGTTRRTKNTVLGNAGPKNAGPENEESENIGPGIRTFCIRNRQNVAMRSNERTSSKRVKCA